MTKRGAFKWDFPRVRVTSGPLQNVLGMVIRRSRKTGGLTVELLEASGAYKVGDTVHVKQTNCRLED
jgi:transcription antitermination factor NusG